MENTRCGAGAVWVWALAASSLLGLAACSGGGAGAQAPEGGSNSVIIPSGDDAASDAAMSGESSSPFIVATDAGGVDADALAPDDGASPADASSCADGSCPFTCKSSRHACGQFCVDDANPAHCGTSCSPCVAPANATATCTPFAGPYLCGWACNPGFTECGNACVDLQTDSHHCGSCGHDCTPGTCAQASCQPWVVAAPPTTISPAGIACDGTNLVWVDSGLKSVLQIPAPGGAPPIILGSPAVTAFDAVAMGGGYVAWTQTYGTGSTALSTLYLATEGSANSPVGQWNMNTPRGLAMDPTGVMAYLNAPNSSGAFQLWACALTTSPGDSSPCTTSAPYTSNQTGPIVADGSNAYWTDFGNAIVWRGTPGFPTNTMTAVATGQTGAYAIALDTTNIYWSVNGGNDTFAIRRTSKAAPSTPVDLTSGQPGGAVALATDGANVYLVANPGIIQSEPVAGGVAPVTLHSGGATSDVRQLVYASGALYWNDFSNNSIYGLRLP
jgi:hypothetical protein